MQNKRPKQKSDYCLEVLDGEILLYHPSHTRIFYCNQTSALIWQLCDGKRTGQEITSLLVEAYPDAETTISTEVDVTLQQFGDQGVIEFV